MSTNPILVITAGNSVAVWDCSPSSASRGALQPTVYNPHGDIPIADASWNHNGQVLATCSALSTDEQVHDNVVLTQVRNGQRLDSLRHNVEWKHRPFAGAINSLAFGGKSRYLCIGDESGAVCIWDLKKRLRVRQFFHDGHPSRQVSLDPTDTYIFSLAPRKFSIYMLKEGTAVRAFHLPPPQPGSGNGGVFTRYHTSALEPNLTAIGTSEGIIHIYDVHQPTHQSNQPIFSFGTRRNSYVTGLAFSPNNSKYLFVSDQEGFLTLYDKNTGQSLHTIASLNESIMAMKMHTNGYLVAVGTERGQVLVYDIRQQSTNMMVASMLVQNGPVTCIQFAPPPKASSTKNGGQQPNAVAQQSSIDETNQYSGPPPPSDNRKQSSPSQKQQQPQTSPAANGKPKMHVPSLSEIQSAKENLSSSQNIEPMNGRRSQSPSPAKQQKPPLPQQQPPQEPAARRQQQQIVVDDQSKASGSTQAYSLQPQQVVGVNSSGSVPSLDDIRDLVRDEVENLKDDVEEAIRNLQLDMISQFHQQSQELKNTLAVQMSTIQSLTEENERLRQRWGDAEGNQSNDFP